MAFRRQHYAQPDLLKTTHVPAATHGMNLVDPISALGALQAAVSLNVIKGERGLIARPGWREHVIHVGATDGEVRSIIPHSSTSGGLDRLFACSPDGIYDATSETATPALKLTFVAPTANAGRGVSVGIVVAGGGFSLYADEENGYHLYTESTDTWAVGSVTGVSPGALAFVTYLKNRAWFVERGTMKAWYLTAGTISGAATSFDLSTVFQKGGHLRGIWSQSLDSGAGRDDNFVFVSSNGEVAIYTGTDPSSDFSLQGLYNVGGVPAGRRLAYAYGGDLLLLTTQGTLPLSTLVGTEELTDKQYATRAVQPLFVQTMAMQSNRIGWEMVLNPKAGVIIVNTPGLPGGVQEQFAMSYSSRGWTRLQGLDILSTTLWGGDMYFGTRDGRVCVSSGYVDDVRIGGVTTFARPVTCFTVGGFSTLGSARYKNVVFVTPRFITKGVVPVQATVVRYDFDIADAVPATGAVAGSGSAWDSAVWGTALWGGGLGTSEIVQGATGRGVNVSVGAAFQAQNYAVLVGFDVAWLEEGIF